MRPMSHDRAGVEIEPPSGNVPKSFLTFVAEQQGGAVVSELSEKLRDLTEAIEMHFEKFRGKVTGEITLKFKLQLEGGAYKVITEYTVKPPKAPVGNTIMWLGSNGDLQARDPRQMTMPFESVRSHS